MTEFTFAGPDGKNHTIEGPEGATPEQAFAMLQQHLGGQGGAEKAPAASPATELTPEQKKLQKDMQTFADRQLLKSVGGAGPAYTAAESAVNTALLNAPRNISAAARSAKTGNTFEHEYDFLKRIDEAAERQSPIASGVGTLGGIGAQIGLMPEMAAESVLGKVAPSWLARGVQGSGIGGVTSGISEFADTKDLGKAGEAALYGAGIGGLLGIAGGKLASAFAPKTPAVNEVASAAERLGVQVPMAVSTESMPVQRAASIAKNVPLVGDPLVEGSRKAIEGMAEANARIAGEFGQGAGYNVAHGIGERLKGVAGEEMAANRQAAEAATQKARAQATSADETAREVAQTALESQKRGALERVSGIETKASGLAERIFGQRTPEELGTLVTERLKTSETAAKANKEALYKEAGQPGRAFVDRPVVEGIYKNVVGKLEEVGRVVDPATTPAAAQMLKRLADVSRLRLQNMASNAGIPAKEAIVGVDLKGLESSRQALNNMAQGASNDADRAASKMIIREFTKSLDDAFDANLFSGDPRALEAYGKARAANRDWRQKFGFNAETDADKVLNKIATGEVTPNEVANWVVGSSKVGAQGSSSRLISRIATATGDDPEVLQAIRSGIWNKLSSSAEGVAEKNPAKVANDIHEFLSGSGSTVAKQVFTEEQRKIAALYADAMRYGQKAREEIEAGHKPIKIADTKVDETRPNVGPLENLMKRVIGAGQGRTDNALFDAINGYTKSTSRGDLKTLSRLLDVIPQEEKGNLAGAIIRRMGATTRAASEFSGDIWLSNWRQITPQAKALLFGTSGTLRQSLEDMAKVSERFKQLTQFSNPSGTGHQVSGVALAAGIIKAPLVTIPAIVGGRIAAEIMARPTTAAAMAKWAKAYELAIRKPGAATATFLIDASRAFSNTIQKNFDKKVDPNDLLPVKPTFSGER
jgi:hypothetical protein